MDHYLLKFISLEIYEVSMVDFKYPTTLSSFWGSRDTQDPQNFVYGPLATSSPRHNRCNHMSGLYYLPNWRSLGLVHEIAQKLKKEV